MNRVLVILALALLAALPASAQDWAKARLEKSPRHGEYVKVKHDGREVECFVVYPEVKNKATAVVLIHEIFGLSDWVRLMADEVAEAGYIAIVPDLLSGMGPKGGGTAELGDQAVRSISNLPPDQVTADLKAVTAHILKDPACNGKAVVAGFCWGGGQSFRFATNSKEIKAAFVFYGPPPSKEDMQRIQVPVYGFYAGNDARISATIPTATADMKADEKKYDPKVYEGAGHGFMRAGDAPDANEANKKARDDSWARLKMLLKKI
ncbi:MAG TPA: dienelactone hydrolase family protein [Chthonomonadaceae bacterium]|nr:dienelactone hydrolase family protein [Chthonomonadaceae bacterium]